MCAPAHTPTFGKALHFLDVYVSNMKASDLLAGPFSVPHWYG